MGYNLKLKKKRIILESLSEWLNPKSRYHASGESVYTLTLRYIFYYLSHLNILSFKITNSQNSTSITYLLPETYSHFGPYCNNRIASLSHPSQRDCSIFTFLGLPL